MIENRRDKIINEKMYSLILPPVTEALQLSHRTVVLLAPVLAGGLGASATDGIGASASQVMSAKNQEERTKVIAEKLLSIVGPALVALTGALGKVDPKAAHELMMDAAIASRLCCEGESVSTSVAFEKHFSANRSDAYQVLTWTLWECVRDFFPKLEGSPLQALGETAKAAWRSQTIGRPTGGSGDPAGPASAPGES